MIHEPDCQRAAACGPLTVASGTEMSWLLRRPMVITGLSSEKSCPASSVALVAKVHEQRLRGRGESLGHGAAQGRRRVEMRSRGTCTGFVVSASG